MKCSSSWDRNKRWYVTVGDRGHPQAITKRPKKRDEGVRYSLGPMTRKEAECVAQKMSSRFREQKGGGDSCT